MISEPEALEGAAATVSSTPPLSTTSSGSPLVTCLALAGHTGDFLHPRPSVTIKYGVLLVS